MWILLVLCVRLARCVCGLFCALFPSAWRGGSTLWILLVLCVRLARLPYRSSSLLFCRFCSSTCVLTFAFFARCLSHPCLPLRSDRSGPLRAWAGTALVHAWDWVTGAVPCCQTCGYDPVRFGGTRSWRFVLEESRGLSPRGRMGGALVSQKKNRDSNRDSNRESNRDSNITITI